LRGASKVQTDGLIFSFTVQGSLLFYVLFALVEEANDLKVEVSVPGNEVGTGEFCIRRNLVHTTDSKRLRSLGHIDLVRASKDLVTTMVSSSREGDRLNSGLKFQMSDSFAFFLEGTKSFDAGKYPILEALLGTTGQDLQGTILKRSVSEHDWYGFGVSISVLDFLVGEEVVVEPFGFKEKFTEELHLCLIEMRAVKFESVDTTELCLAFGLGLLAVFESHIHTASLY